MGWKFKFSAQDRDLEYFFGEIKILHYLTTYSHLYIVQKIQQNCRNFQYCPKRPGLPRLLKTYIHSFFNVSYMYLLVTNLCQHPILLIYYSRVWSRCGGGTTEMLNSEAPKGKELKWTRGPITSSPEPKFFFKVCISGQFL